MSLAFKPPDWAAHCFTRTEALDVLGHVSFAAFAAVRVPGRVLWCNFELARELGFAVPRSNQLTPELHEQLLNTLSLRALTPEERPNGEPVVTLYADKYGGDG